MLRKLGPLVVLPVLLASCGLLPAKEAAPPPETAAAPTPAASTPVASPSPAPAGFVREGLAGLPAEPYRLEVKSVERQGDRTLLKMELTSKLDDKTNGQGAFGDGWSGEDFSRFSLMDTVGGKAYSPLLEKKDGAAYGTRKEYYIHPGVRYPLDVYFPALPQGLEAVTVLAPGTLGEYAGIPVTDGTPGPAPQPSSTEATPAPDSVFQWPVEQPPANAYAEIQDLRELVERPQKSTQQDGTTETIALRTDVLFAFDKATLSAKAAAVLDDVAEETRRRADPSKPPVIIEGHTDGKGTASYNQPLSVKRAKAVRDYLARRLGTDYVYKVTGKGDTDPIAPNEVDGKDSPENRARNRRVEISYQIKEVTPGSTSTEPQDPSTGSVVKSAFHADDAHVVGSFKHKTCCTELRVDVHPFYRDGAYLVGVLDVVNIGDSDHNSAYDPFSSIMHRWSSGADFGEFTVLDPKTKARYFGVRVGQEDHAEGALLFLRPQMKNRVFVYYPAPPDDVTTISLDTGDDGMVENIPITR